MQLCRDVTEKVYQMVLDRTCCKEKGNYDSQDQLQLFYNIIEDH